MIQRDIRNKASQFTGNLKIGGGFQSRVIYMYAFFFFFELRSDPTIQLDSFVHELLLRRDEVKDFSESSKTKFGSGKTILQQMQTNPILYISLTQMRVTNL